MGSGVTGTGGLAISVLLIVANWMVFEKAGQAGWKSIIPIYSTVVQLKIIGKSPWLALLYLLLFVGFLILVIMIGIGMARSFGRSGWFAVGLILLPIVFYPILAFGDSKYIGPGGQASPETGEELAAW
jgi:hypothetical protein